MERSISAGEVEVVNWLLDHAFVDVTSYTIRPTSDLHVVGTCECGCTSLFFHREALVGKIAMAKKGRLTMIADELAVYPDGQQAGLILWGYENEIVWLEVYDFHPDASHRFPEPKNLCTWDDLGRNTVK